MAVTGWDLGARQTARGVGSVAAALQRLALRINGTALPAELDASEAELERTLFG
jgi:hypothetical protein